MERDKAENARVLLDTIGFLKKKIEWLSKKKVVLAFGERSSVGGDRVTASMSENLWLNEILDKHHQLIIDELNEEIKELEGKIEKL